ncbi:FliM/FliN family flagellar motor switch protein [Aestuariivita sp.]|jgi:flagellar motor switch protein FliM|uniref:flagellar motor switch protein FliM n=1 Tax=Aestuariivita sp. TaxID=1872407 RepID=UPI00216BE4F7|nr:FliM/FliN family flagellar motor switch protein [Aestuariivita sp.]MCE8008973.1 flagellar motor switch protein FliM [Aestuariivita sp.]
MSAATPHDGPGGQVADLIDEIIRMSDFSFERLPMLDIIGARMADFLPIALTDLTRSVCEASLNTLDYVPLGQAIADFPDRVLIGVASSQVLEGNFLVVMDAPLVLSTLETSLGGEPSDAKVDGQAEFTAIERGFGLQLARLILGELRQSFSVIGDIVPEVDSLETDGEAAIVAQQASLCVRMDLALQVGNQVCRLQVIFPYDTLEPIRPRLGKVYFGERGDEVSPWRDVLTRQIESATVELEVVLSEMDMPMRQIMALKPGDRIGFPVGEDHECTVICSGSPIFHCVTGTRSNGVAAIRITETIDLEEDA